MPKKGKYIILEGGEGCGKSTQAKLLTEYLKSKRIQAIQCREPGTSEVGEQIREILLNKRNDLSELTELFLFEAARTEFFRQEVIPNLLKGNTIVADRSGYSSLAYQGYAGGQSIMLIEQLNNLSTFRTKHDLAIIIDVEASKGLNKEENADRFANKGKIYHEIVNRGFRQIADYHDDIILIPYKEGDINGMQEEIRLHVDKLF